MTQIIIVDLKHTFVGYMIKLHQRCNSCPCSKSSYHLVKCKHAFKDGRHALTNHNRMPTLSITHLQKNFEITTYSNLSSMNCLVRACAFENKFLRIFEYGISRLRFGLKTFVSSSFYSKTCPKRTPVGPSIFILFDRCPL